MALPTLITVSGTLLDIDGTPAKGHVAFYSGTTALSSADDTVVVPSYILVPVELDGTFEVELPATNDPAWTPEGWTYKVVVNYNGNRYSFSTVIPYDANDGLINFSELLPALEGGSELYAAFNHTHGGGGGGSTAWVDITGKPTTFPPSTHTHDDRYFTEAEVTTALSGKENTGVAATAVANHEADTTNVHGISNTANLATTSSVSSAISSAISAIDYPVDSVAGKTGTVTLVKGDVGLGSADNTSDASKPVSTATQTALDGKAASSHTHTIANVTSLQASLDAKADDSEITALDGRLDVVEAWTRIIVLDSDDPVPGGTPTGTVIVRTA